MVSSQTWLKVGIRATDAEILSRQGKIMNHISAGRILTLSQKPDYLTLSFVTEAEDIIGVRKLMREKFTEIPIIAKVVITDGIPLGLGSTTNLLKTEVI
jgi:pyruvate kinase